jgi:glycosyltransferase involved in cell wall biosynthesis
MSIWAHTLVMNEERYLWYAVMSVIDYVDKFLIWDTGSEDSTVKIIKEIEKARPGKVSFREIGKVNPEGYTTARQEMLDITKSDWLLLVDSDEVWWEDSIRKIVETIKKEGGKFETIVTPYYNVIGDIYHHQGKEAGMYKIDGRKGHLTIRAISRHIPGLYTAKPHGQHGYFDREGKLIQERSNRLRLYIDEPFLHFTHMIRSSSRNLDLEVPKRGAKLKHELGMSFRPDFYYPEVFFRPRPSIVPPVWQKMDAEFLLRALFLTLPRKIKRKVFESPIGY